MTLSTDGISRDDVLAEMAAAATGDADWRSGKTWSLVYNAGPEVEAVSKAAYQAFFSSNALNPMALPSLRRFETEVLENAAQLLHGTEAVGSMTTGGTESILMAVKAYRDRAKKRHPEIVAPETAHVAFEKAAHYFGVKLRKAPIGRDFRADVAEMRRLVNRNTVALVGSAPQYPQGVVDPIEEIAALAREKKLPLHVDACIGGFVLPWVERLGHDVPPWDFRVPGVTSISADLHKYGYAAKGASVVVYRDMSYLKHQFFVSTDWSGGIYASPTMPGTRSGGSIAAAWAAMHAMGEAGYLAHTERAMQATKNLRAGIDAVSGVEVLGSPHCTLFSYGANADDVSLYAVGDQLEDRGWSIDRQQHPASIHCTVTSNHLPIVDEYVRDLAQAVAYVRQHPEVKSRGNAAMYGMMAKIPMRGMVKQGVLKVMEQMYGPEGADDLSGVGKGKNDGPLLRAMNKYGDKALAALDTLDALKQRLTRKSKR